MKKKIIISTTISVVFSLCIASWAFISIASNKEVERTQEVLFNYNNIVKNVEEIDYKVFNDLKIFQNDVRVTVVKKDGAVVYDNAKSNLGNHGDRKEVQDAFNTGQGESVRYSDTEESRVVYCATKISDDMVVRSSVKVENIDVLSEEYIRYYIFALTSSILLTIFFSSKLIKTILYPVEELEHVSYKIANGDLDKRVKICNDGEIGSLAKRFNYMADQLQVKIGDAIDKQNKLEAILESMEGGVIAIDNNDVAMIINPYARNIFGIKSEIVGENIYDYIKDKGIIDFIKELPHVNSKEIKLQGEENKELRVRKTPIINGSNNDIGIVVVINDITEVKRLENMRSQFVANVSHELKTPLTSIKGFAETLKYVEDKQTRNKFINIIDKEAERLTRLINDILVLSNIESAIECTKQQFKPKDVLEDVLNILKETSEKKDIDIDIEIKYDGMLLGNKDKYYQLCLNLIDNAIKYTNEYGKVVVKCYEEGKEIKLIVKDTGIGIPSEDLPRIFERFYRVDKSRGSKGTGLGLAIVKHIVIMFKGDIKVTSTLNEGTMFSITIPIELE